MAGRINKAQPIHLIDGRVATTYRKYLDYQLNPIQFEYDYFGNVIEGNLREIKRKYEALLSGIRLKVEKRNKLREAILSIEDSPRSKYNRLIKKPNKTADEHEKLYFHTVTLEDKSNDLHPLERDIRDSLRLKRAKYPSKIIEFVYKELGEEMPREEN